MLKLLLVEDDLDLAHTLIQYLELEGMLCDHASNGVAGLNLSRNHHYDVLLLDINLPRMDGIEVLHKLRNELSDTHLKNAIVFILTTSEAEKDRERAYAHNIAGYLVKSAEKGGLSGIAEMLNAYHEVVVYP